MTAEPKELKRKPRPIGPRAVEEMADEREEGDLNQGAFEAFQESLSTDELLDLDDAAGGIIGQVEVRPTLRLMLACAWIAKRRTRKGLTWRQVRALPRDEAMALIADFAGEFDAGPKGEDTAPAS